MSKQGHRDGVDDPAANSDSSQGPNLKVVYSLIALALALAIAVAGLIVLPFYRSR
ncbi:MAG: hypothetical protein WBE76_21580 [Terracidiphilus sp.]